MKLGAELRGILTGLALVGCAVLAAVSVRQIAPGQELLQSLRFHIGAVMLGLVVLLFIGRAWWRGVLLLALVLASLGQGVWIIAQQQAGRQVFDGRPVAAQIEVLSFNVLASNDRGGEIVRYIAESAPDIAVIMESNGILPHLTGLAQAFPGRAGCRADGRDCDLMIFSRTPITEARTIELDPFERLRLVVAKTSVRGQSVTVVGLHLSKPYFDEAAYVELYHVRNVLRTLEGPIILAGDFNSAAWSSAVASFARQSDLVPPPYYPATWPVRFGVLGVPIDNMFTRGNAVIGSIEGLQDTFGSNHRGLRAVVDIVGP